MIRLVEVRIPESAERLVIDLLRTGQLAQGATVEAFEHAIAAVVGVDHAIAVSSGTAALVVALQALGIGPGDEVLLPPLTFIASLNAVLESGATARFADIDLDDFTLDVKAVQEQVTDRTVALMPVHLYGQPADMEAIDALASARGIHVVEDAAQALGAKVGARGAGSFGTGCFSFYATKNLTTGEGGMVTTNDAEMARRVRLLRNQGMQARYDYVVPGHNLRMTELQAAVGLAQVAGYGALVERRQSNAARLREGLAGIPGVIALSPRPGRSHVFHLFTVRITEDARRSREAVIQELAARGIDAAAYYPRLVFDYPCFLEHPLVRIDETPNASVAARQVLSLPVHPYLSSSDLDRVIDAMRAVLA